MLVLVRSTTIVVPLTGFDLQRQTHMGQIDFKSTQKIKHIVNPHEVKYLAT